MDTNTPSLIGPLLAAGLALGPMSAAQAAMPDAPSPLGIRMVAIDNADETVTLQVTNLGKAAAHCRAQVRRSDRQIVMTMTGAVPAGQTTRETRSIRAGQYRVWGNCVGTRRGQPFRVDSPDAGIELRVVAATGGAGRNR